VRVKGVVIKREGNKLGGKMQDEINLSEISLAELVKKAEKKVSKLMNRVSEKEKGEVIYALWELRKKVKSKRLKKLLLEFIVKVEEL